MNVTRVQSPPNVFSPGKNSDACPPTPERRTASRRFGKRRAESLGSIQSSILCCGSFQQQLSAASFSGSNSMVLSSGNAGARGANDPPPVSSDASALTTHPFVQSSALLHSEDHAQNTSIPRNAYFSKFRNDFRDPQLVSNDGTVSVFVVKKVMDGLPYVVKRMSRKHADLTNDFGSKQYARVCQHAEVCPYLVEYYDSWHEQDEFFFRVELCTGFTVQAWVQDKVLHVGMVVRFLHHLTHALAHIHALNVAHGAISLATIYVVDGGARRLPLFKLGDFETSTFAVTGSPAMEKDVVDLHACVTQLMTEHSQILPEECPQELTSLLRLMQATHHLPPCAATTAPEDGDAGGEEGEEEEAPFLCQFAEDLSRVQQCQQETDALRRMLQEEWNVNVLPPPVLTTTTSVAHDIPTAGVRVSTASTSTSAVATDVAASTATRRRFTPRFPFPFHSSR